MNKLQSVKACCQIPCDGSCSCCPGTACFRRAKVLLSLRCSSLAACLCSSFHRCAQCAVHGPFLLEPVRSDRQGEHLVPDDLKPEARQRTCETICRALEALWLLTLGGRVREIPEPPGLQRIIGSLVWKLLPKDRTRLSALCVSLRRRAGGHRPVLWFAAEGGLRSRAHVTQQHLLARCSAMPWKLRKQPECAYNPFRMLPAAEDVLRKMLPANAYRRLEEASGDPIEQDCRT